MRAGGGGGESDPVPGRESCFPGYQRFIFAALRGGEENQGSLGDQPAAQPPEKAKQVSAVLWDFNIQERK